jgi:hypothetical protein
VSALLATIQQISRRCDAAFAIALWSSLLAGCDGTESTATSNPALAGSWLGTCEFGAQSTSSTLAMTVDAGGNLAGTITNGDGTSGAISGKLNGANLSARCVYPDGTTNSVNGSLTPTSTTTYQGDLTIGIGTTTIAAECQFSKALANSTSGSTSNTTSGSTSNTTNSAGIAAAMALCQKSAACSNATLDSADAESCANMMSGAFELIPDPNHFVSCVQNLSCTQLADETSVQGCLDLNDATVVCDGSILHGCTNTGACSTVDCTVACSWIETTFDHCGFDSTKHRSVCFCR